MAEAPSRRAQPAPDDDADDLRLVERVRAGDTEAFGLLVRRYSRRALSVAYRILDHPEDAEDLVQDAFIAALEKIDTLRGDRRFAPWFFRILINRGLNARKARWVRRTDEIPAHVTSPGVTPETHSARAELSAGVAVALAALPEPRRTIVKLFELEGFSGPEIAEILGLSPGTVRWHLFQARGALRETLGLFHD
ncbi:MAG TPA: sigma-70 family RNA polymerase sigma factor [Longimicrobiaceae bacterium]|nr:sigma-70 family RNA polymerase sigma factor [Longimicrobiaceae bacterium]